MKKIRIISSTIGVLAIALIGVIYFQSNRTENDISLFRDQVAQQGVKKPAPQYNVVLIKDIPDSVRKYFNFTFRGEVPSYAVVRLEAEGDFRRPLTEEFSATTAEQTIAIGTPALMFSATTPIFNVLWARAYDFFADGKMEMKAKILSAITVVDEQNTIELNQISLRRWLLESPLFPQALLPGGPVTWEALDDSSARAVVSANGLKAAMIFHFDAEGKVTYLTAEEEGDLTTPYHGSGEHVTRSDYRQVSNMMIPHQFTISRAANGKVFPFFKAKLTSIKFETQ